MLVTALTDWLDILSERTMSKPTVLSSHYQMFNSQKTIKLNLTSQEKRSEIECFGKEKSFEQKGALR